MFAATTIWWREKYFVEFEKKKNNKNAVPDPSESLANRPVTEAWKKKTVVSGHSERHANRINVARPAKPFSYISLYYYYGKYISFLVIIRPLSLSLFSPHVPSVNIFPFHLFTHPYPSMPPSYHRTASIVQPYPSPLPVLVTDRGIFSDHCTTVRFDS